MSKLLISRKGKQPIWFIIYGVGMLFFWFWWIVSGLSKHSYSDSDVESFAKIIAPSLIFVLGIVVLLMGIAHGKTSISVYSDHIEGVGVGKVGLNAQKFYFNKSMQYTVQQSGVTIIVSCGGETYSIILGTADAQEVYRIANGIGGNYSSMPMPNCKGAYNTAHNFTRNPAPVRMPVSTPKQNPMAGYTPQYAPVQTPRVAQNSQTYPTKIVFCPRCGTKSRVPIVNRRIQITCPNPACRTTSYH